MPLFHWRLVVVALGLYPVHTRIQRLRFQCRRIGGESARLLSQWHAALMVALLFLTHPSRPEWRPHWGLLPFYHFYLFPFPRCQKLVFELERTFFLKREKVKGCRDPLFHPPGEAMTGDESHSQHPANLANEMAVNPGIQTRPRL